MDVDDEEPPLLVDNDEQQDDAGHMSAELEGLQVSKVPITIVTGWNTKGHNQGIDADFTKVIWEQERPHC